MNKWRSLEVEIVICGCGLKIQIQNDGLIRAEGLKEGVRWENHIVGKI